MNDTAETTTGNGSEAVRTAPLEADSRRQLPTTGTRPEGRFE